VLLLGKGLVLGLLLLLLLGLGRRS